MFITRIPPQYTGLVWPEIKKFVDRSAFYSRERTKSEDIKKDCENGTVFLWVAHDDNHDTYAFVTGQFINYPGIKVLAIQFTGGKKLKLWASDMLNALESFARENSCSKIECAGRYGWMRYAERFGFTNSFYMYEKDLRHESWWRRGRSAAAD